MSIFDILPCPPLRAALSEYDRRISDSIFSGFDSEIIWVGNTETEGYSEAIHLREKIQAKVEKFEREFNAVNYAMNELNISKKWIQPKMHVDPGFIEVNIFSRSLLCNNLFYS